MAIQTTTTLTSLIQDALQASLATPKAPFLFWPGAPLHKMLQVADLTNKGGHTAQFNKRGTLTAYDVVEGVDFSVIQNISTTAADVTATEHQVLTTITDYALESVSSPYDAQVLMAHEAEEHLTAHMKLMDEAVLNLASSLTSGVSTTGSNITIAGLKTLPGLASAANAPQPWVGILSDVQYADLVEESSSAFADASASGRVGYEMWSNYRVPNFLGASWFTSSNVQHVGTTDWYGMFLSNRAIGLTLKKLPTITLEYDQSLRAIEISSVSTWGVGVIDSSMGWYIQTDY